eukprot:Blabericola_migrator_1__227@NODE_105_length_14178_cov_154_704486_g93_i0_p1_GENE_NODE_105_length_14178_cov_154_704486_g93_i0NODE_105_length_14178_cov_154_704486_g93_i0_p1_ORF_typecomplete_len3988_score609_25Chorein_N/PF12624_7/8_1e19SHRBD/PF06650_12/1_5e03SHRBD/PF06650_12/2_7e17VPS13/PF16908_5/5_5e13VPS13/PF16908_5/1_1e02VPS13/PF16908_5/2_3e03VPS13/PF16908_5/7_6e03ATG_C/PF09333_11/4e03ATG_C/PF09333_11/5_6e08VPS13_mid_rpt/PF16910_5/4_2e03VPS13_mid_rpt/PF16910_5/0_00034VPS13_mid_rpt/PF16910_5/3_9e0
MRKAPLNQADSRKLQILHDVVPARYLIQWRAKCQIAAEKVLRARTHKVKVEVEEVRKNQTWWSRMSNKQAEAEVLKRMAETEKDTLFLTDEELEFIEQSISQTQGESGEDDAFAIDPSSMEWILSVTLPQFTLTLTEPESYETSDSPADFLCAKIFELNFSLKLTPKVDHELRDVFEWRFFGALDRFEASQLGKPMVFFQRALNHTRSSSATSFLEVEERSADSSLPLAGESPSLIPINSNSVEIMNSISREGHNLSVKISLMPIVLQLRPVFIRKFMYFFTSELSDAFAEELRKIQEMQKLTGLGPEQNTFLGDYVAEQAEKLKSKMAEQQRDESNAPAGKTFEFDLNMAAPIVILEDSSCGALKFHLGRARIRTQRACKVNDVVVTMELRETQVRYVVYALPNEAPGLDRFHSVAESDYERSVIFDAADNIAVHPIPVSVELQIKHLKHFNLAFTSDQFLVNVEPSLVKLLIAIPQLLLREFHAKDSDTVTPAPDALPLDLPVMDEDSLSEANSMATTREPGVDEALLNEVELATLAEVAGVPQAEGVTISCQFWVARVGLHMLNAEKICTASAEVAGAAATLTYDGITNESLAKLGMIELKLTDPRSDVRLLTTLTPVEKEVSRDMNAAAWKMLDERFVSQSHTDNLFALTLLSWQPPAKLEENASQWLPAGLSQRLRDTRIDDHTLRIPARYVTLSASPVEANWHKASVQSILTTSEELLRMLKQTATSLTAPPDSETKADAPPDLPSLPEALNMMLKLNLKAPASPTSSQMPPRVSEPPPESPPRRDTIKSNALLDGTLPQLVASSLTAGPLPVSMIMDIVVKSAAVSFWEDQNEIFWRMSLQDLHATRTVVDSTGESNVHAVIGWTEISVHNRCVLAPRLDGKHLMSCAFRQYAPDHASLTSVLPYSSCLIGDVAPVDYVYYQQDLTKLIAYLSGSVLETVLWKSYEVAKEIAARSFFLYEFRVNRPRFILSEDKSAIPQVYKPEMRHVGGFRSWKVFEKYGGGTKAEINAVMDELRGHPLVKQTAYEMAVARKPVDLFYLGTNLDLDLGALRVRNQYAAGAGNVVSSVLFHLEGLTAGAKSHINGSYKQDIEGTMLERVLLNLKVHYTAESPVYVDGWTSELSLKLTRPQMSLLLDVMNENLSGGGYQPQPVTITDHEQEMEQIKHSLERPPFQLSVRLRAPAIKLEASFTPQLPVASIEILGIYVGCDVDVYSAFNVYTFGLYGKRYAVTDTRRGAANMYKTFIESNPNSSSESQPVALKTTWGEEHSEKAKNIAEHYPWLPPEAFLVSWKRPGMRQDEERVISAEGLPPPHDIDFDYGARECFRLYFSNCLSRSRFEVDLEQPALCVLVILAMDIFEFVTSGLAFSSMKNFPKPIAAVIDSHVTEGFNSTTSSDGPSEVRARTVFGRVALPENMPFIFAINIIEGCFLFLSDIKSTNNVWRWMTDFTLEGLSDSNGVIFNDLSLPGGKLDLLPDIKAGDLVHTRTCCSSFEVLGRGKYKGLFDPVTQAKPLVHNAHRMAQLSPALHELIMATDSPAIFIGEAFLAFTVPNCQFRLTGRDWSALISAVRNIMQDGPSASDGQPPPPIIPPIYQNQSQVKIFVDPSDQTMFRFFNVDISLQGLTCTFCDDFRSSVVPMMRGTIHSPQISVRYCPATLLITTDETRVRVEYLNTVIGVWEPFIEKLATKMAWRTATPLHRVLKFQRLVLATQRQRRSATHGATVDPTLQAIERFDWEALKGTKQRLRPTQSVRFCATTPMYLNITPRLVQLGLWIIPYITKHMRQSSSQQPANQDDNLVSAAFKCLNLSRTAYLLSRVNEQEDDSISGSKRVGVTLSTLIDAYSRPSKLDPFLAAPMRSHLTGTVQDLATYERLTTSQALLSTDSGPRETLYLTDIPDEDVVRALTIRVQASVSDCVVSEDAVRRALMSTRSENAVKRAFLVEAASKRYSRDTNKDESDLVLNPYPATVGPLPKDSRAFSISLSRASSVSLPNPMRARSSIPVTIAEVISPHPSFQLLLITSIVRIFNHSGLPLQIAFLDENNDPVKLTAPLTEWRAPAEHLSARMSQMALFRGRDGDDSAGIGLSNVFETEEEPVHQLVEEWGRSKEEFPIKKRMAKPDADRFVKPESSYATLQRVDSQIQAIADSQLLSFSLVLPAGYFLSVPQEAFLADGRVRAVFRPLGFLLHDVAKQEGVPLEQALINCLTDPTLQGEGWCTPVDTNRDFADVYEKSKGFMIPEIGVFAARCCCYGSRSIMPFSRKSSKLSKGEKNYLHGDNARLFFELCFTKRTTSLPAEADIKEISIFPAVTGINASPMLLEVTLLNTKIHNKNVMIRGVNVKEDGIYYEKYKIRRTVFPGQTFNFYDLPPPSLTRQVLLTARSTTPEVSKDSAPTQIRMPRQRVLPRNRVRNYAKEGPNEDRQRSMKLLADDSESFEMEDDSDDDDEHQAVVSRIYIEGKTYAPICLELRKEARDVAAVLPKVIDARQQVFVISAPSWFVDRTGCNIAAQDYDKPYPQSSEDSRIRLLEDSLAEGQQAVHLVMPLRGDEKTVYPQIRAEVPPAGGFSSVTMGLEKKYLAMVIRTSKIKLSDTAGALSRVVTVVPKYVITNLSPMPIAIRQAVPNAPATKVNVGQSIPMYWCSREGPAYIEFRPMDGEYEWSSPVIPTEVRAGETHMALYSHQLKTPVDFCIRVCPEDGTFSVLFGVVTSAVIARGQTGVYVHNACPQASQIVLAVDPYHPEALTGRNRTNSLSEAVKNRAHKTVPPETTTAVSWPHPFMTTSRSLTIRVYLGEDYVAPRDPVMINCSLETFKAKTFEVTVAASSLREAGAATLQAFCHSTELALLVRTERRGDRINVNVKPRLSMLPALPRPSRLTPRLTPRPSVVDPMTPTLDRSGIEYVTEVRISKVGISLVSEKLKEEILFAEICQLAYMSGERSDLQNISLRIADIQLDSQLERSEKPVLLANRGSTVKAHASGSPKDALITKSSSLQRAGSISADAINPKTADKAPRLPRREDSLVEDKPFLALKIERPTLPSRDVMLREVRLSLDDVEIDLDVEVLNGISDFYNECLKSLGFSFSSSGVSRADIMDYCRQESMLTNYVPPQLPKLVVLEKLIISRFTVHAWFSFLLDRVSWIGDAMIFLLKVLMVSGRLELKGAPIDFKEEVIDEAPLRGSIKSVVSVMIERYNAQIFNSLATLVGYSSLVNIPRAPLEFLRGTVGVGLNITDQAATGLSSIMSNLTFDKDYINKRQRERQDAKKVAHNLSTGLQAAKQNLTEGAVALGNVFIKPWEGGRKEGLGGFVKGIGTGVMGSLIKPVDKVGQALSNVATGIRAEYVSKPMGAKKLITKRRRKPRMLWGEHGQLRDYEAGDADIRELLGLRFAKNVLQCITLEHRMQPPKHLVLVFYPKEITLLDLALKKSRRAPLISQGSGVTPSSAPPIPTSPMSPGVNPTTPVVTYRAGSRLWTHNITDIEHVVATTHGVILSLTESRKCQVPCASDKMIRRVAAELSNAQRRLRSEVCVTKTGLEHV